jgi:hypothetical protein
VWVFKLCHLTYLSHTISSSPAPPQTALDLPGMLAIPAVLRQVRRKKIFLGLDLGGGATATAADA